MKIGDLVKTVYRDDYGVVTKVWWATVLGEHAAQFVYPDGEKVSLGSSKIREVISANR